MKHSFCFLVLSSILMACSGTAPDPTQTPTVVPCSEEAAVFIDSAESITERWDDANELANSTARMALSGPVETLQQIKRDAGDLEAPACAEHVKARMVRYMELTIDSFLAFLSEEGDSDVQHKILLAQVAQSSFSDSLLAVAADEEDLPNSIGYIVSGYFVRSGRAPTANITYDQSGQSESIREELPWLVTLDAETGSALEVSAQVTSDASASLTCDILINGQIAAEMKDVRQHASVHCDALVP